MTANEEQQSPASASPAAGPEAATVQEAPAPGSLNRADLDRLTAFADDLQRLNLADYIRLTQKPGRLVGLNFISGVARGFGIAVGFTLLGALGFYVLKELNVLNLPLIGDFIARILEYVDMARGIRI